jgi:hypothetical protein
MAKRYHRLGTECFTERRINKLQPIEIVQAQLKSAFKSLKTGGLAPQVGFEPTTLRLTANGDDWYQVLRVAH